MLNGGIPETVDREKEGGINIVEKIGFVVPEREVCPYQQPLGALGYISPKGEKGKGERQFVGVFQFDFPIGGVVGEVEPPRGLLFRC